MTWDDAGNGLQCRFSLHNGDWRVIEMATKSILKSIVIKDGDAVNRLVNAIKESEKKAGTPMIVKKSVSDASRDDIRKMFGS